MKARKCIIGKNVLCEGDHISLDGNTGSVYAGKVEFEIEKPEQLSLEVKKWNQQILFHSSVKKTAAGLFHHDI